MARRSSRWAKRAGELTGAMPERLASRAPAIQLAKLRDAPPPGDSWLHEIKWDGYRIVGTAVDGDVRLWSRNGLDWTHKAPPIVDALVSLGLTAALVDGELIASQGRQADFGGVPKALKAQGKGLTLVLFDVLHVDGISIAASPLLERKALLEEILRTTPSGLAYSSHVVGHGDTAFEHAAGGGFEGIISKRLDRPYTPGRGDDWVKVKVVSSEEFAVVGFAPPEGRTNGFGSLLLATRAPNGSWRYAGRVGTGFSNELLRQLPRHLKGGSSTPTVEGVDNERRSLRHASWFAPRFVAEVFVRGYSSSGVLRQPSLKVVRPDKTINDLGR